MNENNTEKDLNQQEEHPCHDAEDDTLEITQTEPVDSDQIDKKLSEEPQIIEEDNNINDTKAHPHHRNNLTIIICIIFVGIFLTVCMAMVFGNFLNGLANQKHSTVIYKSEDWNNSGKEVSENAIVNAVEKASVSVVAITTESVSYTPIGNYVSKGAGSGVIITEDGYIITNHHVISEATNIQVTLVNGDVHAATLVGTDSKTDLAVIKIDAEGLKPAVLGDSNSLQVGQTVLAIGNPLGTLSNTVTNGILSSLARECTIENTKMTLLQHNAAVSPGNSGGGLFNTNGELIGVVNAKSSGEGIEGIGFAIPLQTVEAVIPQLIENGNMPGAPQMGVTAYEILSYQTIQTIYDKNVRESFEKIRKIGIYIQSDNEVKYAQNSPKLNAGDYLSAIDGQSIVEFQDISAYLSKKAVGDQVTLTVYRYDFETEETNSVSINIILTEKK